MIFAKNSHFFILFLSKNKAPANVDQNSKVGKGSASGITTQQNMLNIFEILDGIEYLPVNNSVFLEIQSFMNHVLSHFQYAMPDNTGAMMFFFDDYLVFSGLQHNEARIIKKYMPMFLDEQSKELNMKQPFAKFFKFSFYISF